jgi:hypothetical protein
MKTIQRAYDEDYKGSYKKSIKTERAPKRRGALFPEWDAGLRQRAAQVLVAGTGLLGVDDFQNDVVA